MKYKWYKHKNLDASVNASINPYTGLFWDYIDVYIIDIRGSVVFYNTNEVLIGDKSFLARNLIKDDHGFVVKFDISCSMEWWNNSMEEVLETSQDSQIKTEIKGEGQKLLDFFFPKYERATWVNKCECGAHFIHSEAHLEWCPLFNKNKENK